MPNLRSDLRHFGLALTPVVSMHRHFSIAQGAPRRALSQASYRTFQRELTTLIDYAITLRSSLRLEGDLEPADPPGSQGSPR